MALASRFPELDATYATLLDAARSGIRSGEDPR